ncbi:MAG TPA: insulinase family protein [Saprospiraceae bacterium]|nr:insulinase family protein [Saprospiraceae bacterium]
MNTFIDKKLLLSGLIVFGLFHGLIAQDFRAHAPEPGPAKPIEIASPDQFALENGMKVILVENHKIPVVNFQLFINRDPLVEGEFAGFSTMAGDLLATGTTSRTKAEIDAAIDFIGASMTTSSTGAFGSTLTKHADAFLDVYSDVILNPVFPEEEFEKLKTQTLSGLAAAKAEPESIANNVVSKVNYGPEHPYGEVQTEETTKAITLQKCKDYYQDYFKPNLAFLVIVGDANHDQAMAWAEKYFGTWKPGPVPRTVVSPVPLPEETAVRFADKSGAVQSVIQVTQPVDLKPGDKDVIAVRLMNNILGYGGFSGRLFQDLREDKGYTYGAYSSLNSDPYVALFNAETSVRNEVTDSSVEAILYEINKIREEPVSDKELQLTKNITSGQFARAMERPQTIATFALNIARYGLPEDYYQTYLQRMEAVTVADIQRVARKYLQPDHLNIVVVGNKDEVVDKLKAFGPLYYYDNNGDPVQINATDISDVTPESVIKGYLQAIGGVSKVGQIKNVKAEMVAKTPMGEISMEVMHKDNMKSVMKISAQGMVVQEQRFDGEKAMISQMGNKELIDDPAMVNRFKENAAYFEDLKFLQDGYHIEIKGVENVDGIPAYRLVVTSPAGSISTYFYALESKLKIRQVQSADGNTTNIDYKDYEDHHGILVPKIMSISGSTPVPMSFELSSIEFNPELEDAWFSVDN